MPIGYPNVEPSNPTLLTVASVNTSITPVVNNVPTVSDVSGSLQYPLGITIAGPTQANRGANIVCGYAGNSIDSLNYSCSIVSGGLQGFPNKMINLSGAVSSYNTIGGYDNVVTGGTVQNFGWHSRWNTATLATDTTYIGSLQTGTISASGSTVTGSGTNFLSLKVGGAIIANNTGGPVNSVSGGTTGVTNGTALHITAITSATSVTVAETGLSIAGGTAFYNTGWFVVNDSYTPTITCNNSIIMGAFNAEYNGNGWNAFLGGRQNVVGWDGVNQTSSQLNTIGGDSNLTTGNANTVFGTSNTAIGNNSFGGGDTNSVYGNHTRFGGSGNSVGSVSFSCSYNDTSGSGHVITATGSSQGDYTSVHGIGHIVTNSKYAFVTGANSTIGANANYSFAGGNGVRIDKYGQFTRSSGKIVSNGDNQYSLLAAHCATTDATPTNLALNGAATSVDRLDMKVNNTTWQFRLTIVAAVVGTPGTHATWVWRGDIFRTTTSASTTVNNLYLEGSAVSVVTGLPSAVTPGTATASLYPVGSSSAWTVAVSADTTNGGLQRQVVGAVATSIRWSERIELVEVSG